MNGVIWDGPRSARLLHRRQRGLGELHVTARAPGGAAPDLPCASLSMVLCAMRPEGRDIAGSRLHDAAAMARAPHHLIADADRVHDVEGIERDMRRPERVCSRGRTRNPAAGRARPAPPWALVQPPQQIVVELQAGNVG